jgi:hypothetical protein
VKKLILSLILASAALPARAQTNLPPANVEKTRNLIALIGDNTQLMGGAAIVADPRDHWRSEVSAVVGVQGNVATWQIRVSKLRLQSSVRPGLVYLYATETEKHLVGVGLCGRLSALPPVLADTKNATGLLGKLPGNLEAVDWFVSVGSQSDAARPYLAGGLSLKW